MCYCRGRDWCAEQSALCRLSVCKDYQSVNLHVHLYQQRLDSFSPSTGLDGVRFFSVWKETCASFYRSWLATFQIVAMGFSAFIQINLTVIALALACRFQAISFPLHLHVSEGKGKIYLGLKISTSYTSV